MHLGSSASSSTPSHGENEPVPPGLAQIQESINYSESPIVLISGDQHRTSNTGVDSQEEDTLPQTDDVPTQDDGGPNQEEEQIQEEGEPSSSLGALGPVDVSNPPTAVVEDDDDSDAASEGEDLLRMKQKRAKLFRYLPGLWLDVELSDSLFCDMTNYPYDLRMEVLKILIEKKLITEQTQIDELKVKWQLTETTGEENVVVGPWELLPRFIWYQQELKNAFPKCSIQQLPSSTPLTFPAPPGPHQIPSLPTEHASSSQETPGLATTIEGVTPAVPHEPSTTSPLEVAATTSESEAVAQLSEPSAVNRVACEAGADDITIVSTKGKKKRKIVLQTLSSSAAGDGGASATEASVESRAFDRPQAPPLQNLRRLDSLSHAIREMQFRLTRHGTVADPRSYFGKGDSNYDRRDPWFDDEALFEEIGLSNEDWAAAESGGDSDSNNSDNSNESDESDGGDDSEQEMVLERIAHGYFQQEANFAFDNLSEASEEDDDENNLEDAEPRHIYYDFIKPATGVVFNPRGWRHPRGKVPPECPALCRLFFAHLESLVPLKKVSVLQRKVYETADFTEVDTENQKLEIHEKGKESLEALLQDVISYGFQTFLNPYMPLENVSNLENLQLPRVCQTTKNRWEPMLRDFEAAFNEGFVIHEPEAVDNITEALQQKISPYSPKREFINTLYWTAVGYHTLRTYCLKEDQFVELATDYFSNYIKGDVDLVQVASNLASWKLDEESAAAASLAASSSSSVSNNNSSAALFEIEGFQRLDIFDSLIVEFAAAYNLTRNLFRDMVDGGCVCLLKFFCPWNFSSSSSDGFGEAISLTDKQTAEKLLSMQAVKRMADLIRDIDVQKEPDDTTETEVKEEGQKKEEAQGEKPGEQGEEDTAKPTEDEAKEVKIKVSFDCQIRWLEGRLREAKKKFKRNIYERRKPRPLAKAATQGVKASDANNVGATTAAPTIGGAASNGRKRKEEAPPKASMGPPAKRKKFDANTMPEEKAAMLKKDQQNDDRQLRLTLSDHSAVASRYCLELQSKPSLVMDALRYATMQFGGRPYREIVLSRDKVAVTSQNNEEEKEDILLSVCLASAVWTLDPEALNIVVDRQPKTQEEEEASVEEAIAPFSFPITAPEEVARPPLPLPPQTSLKFASCVIWGAILLRQNDSAILPPFR